MGEELNLFVLLQNPKEVVDRFAVDDPVPDSLRFLDEGVGFLDEVGLSPRLGDDEDVETALLLWSLLLLLGGEAFGGGAGCCC